LHDLELNFAAIEKVQHFSAEESIVAKEIGNDREDALRWESLPFPVTLEKVDGFTRLAPGARGLRISFQEGGPQAVIQGDDPPAAIRLAVRDGQSIVRRAS